MSPDEMKLRTKQFAIQTATVILQLETTLINRAYSAQLIRCSSSVAANYRAVRRAKSRPDFINKLKIVEEELDESLLFLELLLHFNPKHTDSFEVLMQETEELLRIIVASLNTARKNK
jgi:four helix bundle protein